MSTMSNLDELERLLDNAAGEAFLPPAWQRIAASLPALLAIARREERLREVLEKVAGLQPNALAYIRSNGFVMDVVGPLPDDADELTRWKVLAFSLYSDLCEAESEARAALTPEEGQA